MHGNVALSWKYTRQVCLFKLQEGLEVILVGRIFTVWGEIIEPLGKQTARRNIVLLLGL